MNDVGLDYLEFTAARCRTHRELDKWHESATAMLMTLVLYIPNNTYDELKAYIDTLYIKERSKVRKPY